MFRRLRVELGLQRPDPRDVVVQFIGLELAGVDQLERPSAELAVELPELVPLCRSSIP
jgi:hypothetical protein